MAQYDVVLPEREGGAAPSDIVWCTECEAFEYKPVEGKPVPASQAPISYRFWERLAKRYGRGSGRYREWVNDGQPEV